MPFELWHLTRPAAWLLAVATGAAAVAGLLPIWFAVAAILRDLLGGRAREPVPGLLIASRLTQAAALVMLAINASAADAALAVAGGLAAVTAAALAAIRLIPAPHGSVRRTLRAA